MDAETKDFLERMVEGLTIMITTQIDALRTEMRVEIGSLRAEVSQLRDELRDFRIAVDERFRTLEKRVDKLDTRVTKGIVGLEARLTEGFAGIEARLNGHSVEIAEIRKKLGELRQAVDAEGTSTGKRLDELHADVRQRFRVLNERVGAIEKRLAA